MKRFDDAIRRSLRWAQPKMLRQAFELRDADELVATLEFRSSFGTLATARTAAGAWTFKRVGFWQTRATVRADGQTDDLGVFEPNTWSDGGTLTLADGRSMKVTTNLWQSKIEFLGAGDELLFRYDTSGLLRDEASLTVSHTALAMAELSWLVCFGWYLVVSMRGDSPAC